MIGRKKEEMQRDTFCLQSWGPLLNCFRKIVKVLYFELTGQKFSRANGGYIESIFIQLTNVHNILSSRPFALPQSP